MDSFLQKQRVKSCLGDCIGTKTNIIWTKLIIKYLLIILFFALSVYITCTCVHECVCQCNRVCQCVYIHMPECESMCQCMCWYIWMYMGVYGCKWVYMDVYVSGCGGLNENGSYWLNVWILNIQLLELFGKSYGVWSYWRRHATGGRFWGFKRPVPWRLQRFPMCSLFPVCGSRCELSAASPVPCLPVCSHTPHLGGHGLSLTSEAVNPE